MWVVLIKKPVLESNYFMKKIMIGCKRCLLYSKLKLKIHLIHTIRLNSNTSFFSSFLPIKIVRNQYGRIDIFSNLTFSGIFKF